MGDPTVASVTSTRASVRFGTLRIGLVLPDERYGSVFAAATRSMLEPPGPADLTLEITDDAPTAGPPALTVERGDDGVIWRSPGGFAVVHDGGARLHMCSPDSLAGQGMDEDEIHFWLVVLVQKALLARGLVRLHAGAVSVNGRTVVLIGDKGAGKSTTVLALGQRGAVVLGDDQLAAQCDGDGVAVAGSHAMIRLTADTESRLLPEPLPVEPIWLAGVPKKEVLLQSVVPAAPFEAHQPTDLWFLRVGDRFEHRPLPRAEALARLVRLVAPQHRLADNRDRAELIDVLSRLAERTVARDVSLSPDLDDLGLVWDELAG